LALATAYSIYHWSICFDMLLQEEWQISGLVALFFAELVFKIADFFTVF